MKQLTPARHDLREIHSTSALATFKFARFRWALLAELDLLDLHHQSFTTQADFTRHVEPTSTEAKLGCQKVDMAALLALGNTSSVELVSAAETTGGYKKCRRPGHYNLAGL